MIVLGIILASWVMYLVIGMGLVKYDTPPSIRRAAGEQFYSVSGYDRKDIAFSQTINLFLWPVMFPVRFAQNYSRNIINTVDPAILAAAKNRIKQLEQEADEAAEKERKRAERELENQINMAQLRALKESR